MSNLPHPIPYQGSKRNLAKEILRYFPDDIATLYEPFAGSSAISIAAAYHRKAQHFHLNDLNEPLMGIWEYILNDPADLIHKYDYLWNEQLGNEKEFYNEIRDKFNKNHRPDYLLYLLARCVKNAVRYNDSGEFNQGPDNRRKGRRPNTMAREINGANILLAGRTTTSSEDYVKIGLNAEEKDVLYMDPPYQGTRDSSKRYIQGLDLDKFIGYLDELNQRNISYIISFDGRTGDKTYGEKLPEFLNLHHIEIKAGKSSQSTLLGRDEETIESLYLSNALLNRIELEEDEKEGEQLALFGG